MFGRVINLICVLWRCLDTEWEPKQLCQVTTGPIMGQPQEVISTPRGAQGQEETQIKDSERDLVQSPLRPVHTEPQPVSRSETIMMCSWGTALQFTFWTNSVASWGCGTHCRVQGKSFWGLLRSYYLECLGDEQKVERVSNIGDTGRNVSGK